MSYDLLLKGATVVDPGQGRHGVYDVAVAAGVIAEIGERLDGPARQTIRLDGKILTPGWIDIHAHVYAGATTFGIKADALCLATGVTTVVDAGSPGWTNVRGFKEFIADPARTRILTFVHISSIGLLNSMRGEMEDIHNADPERTAQVIEMWPDLCIGVKVRQGRLQVGENGIEPLKRAVEAAEMVGVRLMVHIDQGVPLSSVLERLRPGDIVTHCYHGKGDNILNGGETVVPEVYEARKRGVFFDLGHGAGSFHYEVARKAIRQGFYSDVISTDLHIYSLFDPVYSLPETASKVLNLGVSLEEVVRQTTINAARAIGRDDTLGALIPGAVADIAVFELKEGEFVFTDSHGQQEMGNRKIEPVLTVRAGTVYHPADLQGEIEETRQRAVEMKSITGLPFGAVKKTEPRLK
ncbi:MAG: amidohydrolase/deacetylase family metallohydrolase [candidate division Zixibacteria bacterium]|nr:amidohydrolase/deacetylase family metallohydrolase [candidate division Zixibacteria bacterium]